MNEEKELLKQNLELSDLLEEIVNILGFDKIKDLYVHQAKITKLRLDKCSQQPQRQDSLNRQLSDVIAAANKMGCYDAADWISNRVSTAIHHSILTSKK